MADNFMQPISSIEAIVKKFVSKNPDMKPQDIMKMDARKILEEAKYKPK